MALDPDFKTDWLAELRSGKYRQAKRILKNRDGSYCCLGVAACVLRDKHPGLLRDTGFRVHETGQRLVLKSDKYDCDSSIPTRLANAIGLSDQVPLIDLNDTGHGFEEIADYIEENL
jgi:hypothetical protein